MLIFDSATVDQSAQNQFVELQINMSHFNILGDPIFVDFALTNKLDEAISLNHRNVEDDIILRLHDDRGAVIPLTDYGIKHIGGDPYEFTFNSPISLPPGASLHWRYDLCRYFQIIKVGRYQLFARRTVDGYGSHHGGGLSTEVNVGPILFVVHGE